MNWPDEPFIIPEEARVLLEETGRLGAIARTEWEVMLRRYEVVYPDLTVEFQRAMAGELPEIWDAAMPDFSDVTTIATRAASGQTLNALIPNNPDLLGGSADLTGSNKTKTTDSQIIQKCDYSGRYIHYTALILTRQEIPVLSTEKANGVVNGAYIRSDVPKPRVILIATGSEVHIALAAQKQLAERNIAARFVSMPCWELFEAMPRAYQDEVLPPQLTARVAVEAAAPLGWERYVGAQGKVIGLNRFGASAPYQTIYEKLGITAAATVEAACELVHDSSPKLAYLESYPLVDANEMLPQSD